MDIDGLGEKQVSLFMDLGWVRTAADFYRLDRRADRVADRASARSRRRSWSTRSRRSKQQPFGRVLYALGIEEVGYVTGRNLAQHFRTIDALLAAAPEQIEQTPGRRPEDGAA